MERYFLLLFFIFSLGCKGESRPTGFKAGPSYPGDDNIVKTCDEDNFLGLWWQIETDNIIVNTLVPAYKDYCTYAEEDYVFFWNLDEQYGYYNYDFYWKCANENTMYITNESTGDVIDMRIYGSVGDGCYDVQITYANNVINADLCPCEYNGP